jgi:hypothetical protein
LFQLPLKSDVVRARDQRGDGLEGRVGLKQKTLFV